jgi:hypothetical protein
MTGQRVVRQSGDRPLVHLGGAKCHSADVNSLM